ncbi:DUF262 domain-containing protein [Rhodoglobus sp.]
MAKAKVKLTNNADEADISSLMGNDSIFSIPFFQRPYKWKPARLSQLNVDLLSLVDEESDVHFLGAIIIHGLSGKPAEASVYEVIDGQQRLTTMYLYMCAVVRSLIDLGEHAEAANLFRKYLVTSISTGARSNLTLHPCKEDQGDLNAVIREVLGTKNFDQSLQGFSFVPLPESTQTKGRIAANFLLAKKFFRAQIAEGGVERIRLLYTCLLQKMSVVQIDVQDPTNGPKIFDSLNSRQEPMTIGDLVRNDVFTRVAIENPEEATTIETHNWQPFYAGFKLGDKNYFDDYFFPFGLIHEPNLRKSEVYTTLKKRWDGKNPIEVIDELHNYQNDFLDLVTSGNRTKSPVEISRRIDRLRLAKMPGSTFPFVMRLTRAAAEEEIDISDAIEILDVLDAFLTRRAICGHEPTGLHAVFKRLWQDCEGDITASRVTKEISEHKTVAWPDDALVQASVMNRPAYGTSITKYVLAQYEESLGGDKVDTDPWIEHVLPNSHSAAWASFTNKEHDEKKDLLANLIPLSSAMNSSLGNAKYEKKRDRYANDSAFKTAREFSKAYETWSPSDLDNRSELLADWFIKRWAYSA